ncbi:MAG: hypothetical protein ABJE95_23530 [Byssovorax sp.]
MNEDAVFDALCRIQSDTHAKEGPEASFARFLQEATKGPANDEDDFPDFSKEPACGPSPRSMPEAAEPERGPEGTDALMKALLRTLGTYQGLLERYNRDFDEVFARRARAEPEEDDETIRRLRAAQTILVKYPVASQAAFAALVREGRLFAKTEEGQRWKRRLTPSPMLAKARTLFEGLAKGIVAEQGAALPSTYVEALVHALDRELEGVLADIGGVGSDP